MKTTGMTVLVALLCTFQGLAQGTLSFANGSASRIYDGSSFIFPTPLLNDTNYHVGFYYDTDTNAVGLAGFQFGGSLMAVTNMSLMAGRFFGGTRVVPGVAAGSYIAAQIRVWKGPYATFEDMLNAGVYDAYGNCIGGVCDPRGYSMPFLVGPLGNGVSLPASLINLQSFSLTVAPIPEPSTVWLAGLAAIFFAWGARRRRQFRGPLSKAARVFHCQPGPKQRNWG